MGDITPVGDQGGPHTRASQLRLRELRGCGDPGPRGDTHTANKRGHPAAQGVRQCQHWAKDRTVQMGSHSDRNRTQRSFPQPQGQW